MNRTDALIAAADNYRAVCVDVAQRIEALSARTQPGWKRTAAQLLIVLDQDKALGLLTDAALRPDTWPVGER